MLTSIYALVKDVTYLDFVDVILVSVFFYCIILLIKSTQAWQILQGLCALLLLQGIAYLLQMQTLSYILNGILVSTMVALPVVFQPELRRALTRLGEQGFVMSTREIAPEELSRIINELAFAAANMSTVRHGALMVIELETGMQEIVETGTAIDARITSQLLQNIFWPNTPLHDGAVIIRCNKIAAASCYLPLTPSVVDSRYGTRHRAALGITEKSDAIVLVVSEETGEIRIARDGVFGKPMTEEAQVRKALDKELAVDANKDRRRRFSRLGRSSTTINIGGGGD